MFQYVVGGIIGAIIMGRTKPKTQMRSVQCFGPRTGIVWVAEVMPGEGVVAIHAPAPDNTIALFHRTEKGFTLLRALQGYDQTVKMMQKDLEP